MAMNSTFIHNIHYNPLILECMCELKARLNEIQEKVYDAQVYYAKSISHLANAAKLIQLNQGTSQRHEVMCYLQRKRYTIHCNGT